VTAGVSKSQQGMNSRSPSHVPASYRIKTPMKQEMWPQIGLGKHMNLQPSVLITGECCNVRLYGNSQL